MKEGIDTLKLRLLDYEIDSNANLTVQPVTQNLSGSNESNEDSILYKSDHLTIQGSKAYLNTDKYNLTLSNKGLFLQFSAPKQLNESNVNLITAKELEAGIESVNKNLSENGIHTNLSNSLLSRYDVFRQPVMNEIFLRYVPVLAMLNGTRQNKRDYGTTYSFFNSNNETCFYDKGYEQSIDRKLTNYTNLVRAENRLLNSKAIKQRGYFQTCSDLCNNYDAISEVYQDRIQVIFKCDPSECEVICIDPANFENLIMQTCYKNEGTFDLRMMKTVFFKAQLKQYFDQGLTMDKMIEFLLPLYSSSNIRQTKSRLTKQLNEISFNDNLFEFNGKYYDELYKKMVL